MERTIRFPGAPGFLEFHILADNINDIEAGLDVFGGGTHRASDSVLFYRHSNIPPNRKPPDWAVREKNSIIPHCQR